MQKRTYTRQETRTPDVPSSVAKVETSPFLEGALAVTDYTVAADLQDLDDKIKSMMIFSENRTTENKRMRICKVCAKEGKWSNIRDHIEANHITGVSHTCNICGKITRSRNAMIKHKTKNHKTN